MLRLLLLLTLVVTGVLASAGALPKFEQELIPKNGGYINGFSVAINSAGGTRAIVGGPSLFLDIEIGSNGSVAVFDKFGSTWTQTAILKRNTFDLPLHQRLSLHMFRALR